MERLLRTSWANSRIFPVNMSATRKVVIISLTAGVAFLGILSIFRWRKPPGAPRRRRRYTSQRTRFYYTHCRPMASRSTGAVTLAPSTENQTGRCPF